MASIQEELEKATKKLEQTERKLQQLEENIEQNAGKPPRERLLELNEEIQSLELTRDLAQWHAASESPALLVNDAKQCVSLTQVMMRHERQGLLQHVYEEEYQPLYRYVRAQLLVNLRQSLRRIKYPSKEASSILQQEMDDFSEKEETVSSYTMWLTRLQLEHDALQAHMTGEPVAPRKLESVIELCQPIVERVTFHFLQESEDRISSTRIDRLPEWVLNYIRENALEGGPFEFLSDVAAELKLDAMLFQFLQEMSQLAAYVIIQRNFFRHEKIVGPKSTPILLSGAIEQLLAFDSYVRELVPLEVYPPSLSQLLIAEDEELWTWFINNERAWTMSTLFDTKVTLENAPRRLSPRAELFSALTYSIQSKAAFFANSSYVTNVGVPLCQHFLEAVHESSTELRGLMSQRKQVSTEDLEKNLEAWMDLINGTHMAAIRLSQSTHEHCYDLARVGRSMDRLRDAMVDECSTTLIETVVMERAKLASYLMRCSHMLSQEDTPEDSMELAPDLQETATVFSAVLQVCRDLESSPEDQDELKSIISYAPMALCSKITELLADKFLEVILDAHGMTPDIHLHGAQSFNGDVIAVFDGEPRPPLAMRLLEIARFATMDTKRFSEMKMALSGLVVQPGEPSTLYYQAFAQDGTILDEAVSMIRAKGYSWMHLEDALSILNRRDKYSANQPHYE